MSDNEYLHADITRNIIGTAMKVHSTLGNGFQEVIYQRALAIEMGKKGMSFQRELIMQVRISARGRWISWWKRE
jgi:GxxExxY protein